MDKTNKICFLFISAVIFNSYLSYAQDENLKAKEFAKAFQQEAAARAEIVTPPENNSPSWIESIEFLTGWGWSNLKSNNSYDIVPFIVDLGFGLKPLTKKIGFNPPGILQFQIEPFLSFVEYPSANVEVGTSFMIKIGLAPETWKLQPYLKGGVGIMYTSQATNEQATKFNFNEPIGLGVHYFFKENLALTLEGRYRHVSNCGIDHPNNGINTYIVLAGINYKY